MSRNIKKAPNRGGKGLLGVDSERACPLSLNCTTKNTHGVRDILQEHPALSNTPSVVLWCAVKCRGAKPCAKCSGVGNSVAPSPPRSESRSYAMRSRGYQRNGPSWLVSLNVFRATPYGVTVFHRKLKAGLIK